MATFQRAVRRAAGVGALVFVLVQAPGAESHGEGPILTTSYPMQFLTEFIAGDAAQVICPVPRDADPSFWQPSRDEIARFQRAALIIINGAEYEKWIAAAALPDSRIVDTSRSFAPEWLSFETTTHSHGAGGTHTHTGVDGHTWMDPLNAKVQAQAIQAALARRWPNRAAQFEGRFRQLAAELEHLDSRFRALTPQLSSVVLIASHPAYNYIARRYSWEIVNVSVDPDAPLSDAEVAAISLALAKFPVSAARRVLLWEHSPPAQTANALTERFQFAHVVFSPCEMRTTAQRAAGDDYFERMHANLDRLAASCPAAGP